MLLFPSNCRKMSLCDNQILFLASNRWSGLCGLITGRLWKHSLIPVFSFKGQLHHFCFQPFSPLLILMSFHGECCILTDEIKAKTWNKKNTSLFFKHKNGKSPISALASGKSFIQCPQEIGFQKLLLFFMEGKKKKKTKPRIFSEPD